MHWCALFLGLLLISPEIGWAQFNPVKPSSAGGTPIPPGSIAYPGQNPTTQFNGQAFITPFGPGTTAQGAYDAVAWFKITDQAPNYGIPPGWVGTSSTMGYCHPQAGGSAWWVYLYWPPGGTSLILSGGTSCQSPFPVPISSRLAIHYVGQPNGPEQPASQPAEGPSCSVIPSSAAPSVLDPICPRTGIYYRTDVDIELPDVMPLTVSRTYRTSDTASRAFGIGTSHPYEQSLLRDDLCTAARIYLQDGSFMSFTRVSGTNCLDSTLQHTTTPSNFYAATLAWDQGFQRYRLKFKDGMEWRFSEYGSLVVMLDRNGNTTTLTRALDGGLTGNLTKITSPNGRYLALTYDAANRVTQVTDILGRPVSYTYDASGRLWKVTNAEGGVTEYTYDGSHRMLTLKEPTGSIRTTNTYDANGRVATQTLADGTVSSLVYTLDGNGKIVQTDTTDARGATQRLTFNSSGYTLTKVEALGQPEAQTTTYEWQANTNLLLSVTDALNRKTAYTYDAKGNTLTVTKLATTANAVTTTLTYEPVFNQVATVTDPLNHTTTFGYDAKGNLTTITNALNKVTTITVNPQGQPLTIKDPLNNLTTLTYEVGDLVKVKDPLNRETQRILDAAGRLRNVTNPLGQKTLYTPDALDRITQLVDAINGTTAFTYDANSNLLTVTDAKSQQTVYTYNNMNRTATRKDPLLKTEAYTYDNNGNLATVTDRKSQVTTSTYDLLNRKTKATYQDGTSTNYTYDAGNRVTQVQEKNSGGTVTATITRAYDGLDRLTQEVTAQGTVTYTYDNASRRATMTVAGQPTVTYTYDNANRLTQITQGANLVTIGYDDADRRASLTLPNGNSVVYAYNAASELLSLTYKQGATVIGDLTYTYDAAGNRIKQGGAFARSTIPPALATASYNVNNQQTRFGTNTLTYDFNGNIQTVTDAGGTATYSWNARNQLAGIISTGFSASFSYDSFGRRTGKTIQGTTTNFVYDGLNPVQEKAGTTVTANLLTGLGIDEFLTRTDGAGTRGLLTDALGSTVALGDGTGALQTQYTYEPFGYATQTGQANTSSYKYTGREDDGSGLYYYRARYYHPRLQRFISEDPIGFVGGDVNFYGYVANDPLTYLDSYGLTGSAVLPWSGAGAGAIETAGGIIGGAGSAAAVWGSIFIFPDEAGAGSDILPLPGSEIDSDWDFPIVPPYNIPDIGNSCPSDPFQYKEHEANKQKKNWDKHTKPKSGRDTEKKKQHPGWIPNPNKRRP